MWELIVMHFGIEEGGKPFGNAGFYSSEMISRLEFHLQMKEKGQVYKKEMGREVDVGSSNHVNKRNVKSLLQTGGLCLLVP